MSFARHPDVELCRQERDTSAWGKDASQGQHALVMELGCFFCWSHVLPHGLCEEPWLGRGGGAQHKGHLHCNISCPGWSWAKLDLLFLKTYGFQVVLGPYPGGLIRGTEPGEKGIRAYFRFQEVATL